MILQIPVIVLLVILLVPAVIFDVKYNKIPNYLVLPFWIIPPVSYVFLSGSDAALNSIYGLCAILLTTFPLFALGWMGAGDVKLMSAVAALVGLKLAFFVLLGIVLAGLLLSIVILLQKGLLLETLRRYAAMIGLSKILKTTVYIDPTTEEKKLILPYAIPIAVGTVASLLILSLE